MGIAKMDMRKASFTVESTFVLTITIWIVMSICYFSMYAHDRTVLYALAQNHVEEWSEQKENEKVISESLQQYADNYLVITEVQGVKMRKGIHKVDATIDYRLKIHFPFVNKLFQTKEKGEIKISRENLRPAYYLWDSQVVEEMIGQ